MRIINETKINILVDGDEISPNDSCKVDERCFDTHTIMSEHGRIVITTEYCHRDFKHIGKLKAVELDTRDNNGQKFIRIFE